MNRRAVLRRAGAGAATAVLLGAGATAGCCCGRHCPCEDMCPYCAECDDDPPATL